MYGYDVFMNFYAGSSDVYADLIITNDFAKSIGSPTFKDASLLLKLKDGAGSYSLWGEKPVDGKLAVGESACLYQDSNGADTWQACPGFGAMSTHGWSPLPTKITAFRSSAAPRGPSRIHGRLQQHGASERAFGRR